MNSEMPSPGRQVSGMAMAKLTRSVGREAAGGAIPTTSPSPTRPQHGGKPGKLGRRVGLDVAPALRPGRAVPGRRDGTESQTQENSETWLPAAPRVLHEDVDDLRVSPRQGRHRCERMFE